MWNPAQPICLDISNYQPATIPPEWKDLGVNRLIVGCQDVEHAKSQIVSARDLGIQVTDLYAFGTIMDADDVSTGVGNVLEVASSCGDVHTAWVDCERAALSLEAVRLARKEIEDAGLRCGIYTGPYYWRDHMANSAEFSMLPLWLADYFYSGLPWPEGSNPKSLFGLPWESIAIHQYTSSGTRNDNASGGITPPLAGINVDYNFVYEVDDVDVQELNTAIMNREALRALASGDYDKVLKAIVALKAAGIL